MSRYSMAIAGGALSLAVSGLASAQSTTQTVTFQVQAINEIAASAIPSLIVSTATAGSNPDQASVSGTYDITTNELTKKITLEIDSDMPNGLTLKATLAAPSGGTSLGAVTLGHTSGAVDAVTGISTLAASGLSATYTLDATAAAGVIASATRTLTFTIVAGP